jgi:hypothetical protein
MRGGGVEEFRPKADPLGGVGKVGDPTEENSGLAGAMVGEEWEAGAVLPAHPPGYLLTESARHKGLLIAGGAIPHMAIGDGHALNDGAVIGFGRILGPDYRIGDGPPWVTH